MSYRYLQVSRDTSAIAHISLNRPEKRNALNQAMMEELSDAFAVLQADPQLCIVVLSGAGKVFCAGLDLSESLQSQNAKQMALAISEVLAAIYLSPLVTIAVLEGDAIAGGAGIAAACDFVLAAEDVRIGFPEVHRGMVAAVVSTILCRQICRRDVGQLLLTGDLISAKQAYEMRLITHAVSRESLAGTLQMLMGKILKGFPSALKESKKLLHRLAPADLSDDMEKALAVYDLASLSEESKEGMAAFLKGKSQKAEGSLSE